MDNQSEPVIWKKNMMKMNKELIISHTLLFSFVCLYALTYQEFLTWDSLQLNQLAAAC